SSGASNTELRICRLQSCGSSRGPMSPSVSPCSPNEAAKERARSIRSPNSAAAAAGSVSSAGGVESIIESGRQHDDVAVLRLTLGFAVGPTLADQSMHELALVRRHGLERHADGAAGHRSG